MATEDNQLNTIHARLIKGIELYQQGQYKLAQVQFEYVLSKDNSCLIAHRSLAEIALIEGTAKNHIKPLQACSAIHPASSEVSHTLAMCYQQARELPLAIEQYRNALDIILNTPPSHSYKPKPKNKFDTKIHENLLWKTLALFRQANIKSFATAGSLLGIVREGTILPFDKDIDIGVDWGQMEQAIALLQRHGWHEHMRSYDLINPRSFAHPDGVTLDLCGFGVDSASQKAICGLWMSGIPFGWNRITEYPAINLVDRTTPFGKVWHLAQPELTLNALYGDWQTPDPLFDTILCAKNIRSFSLLTQCFVYSRLYKLCLMNEWNKLEHTLNLLSFFDKHDVLINKLTDKAKCMQI
ncbi:tetratricopeptide repeat protein [Pseudoalteromonas atlantica]|uniref:tetratricopeptide repeat protein n=1 Tax=Pseudoalteromonas atlantica TaxID=288 RepID=UPI003735D90D